MRLYALPAAVMAALLAGGCASTPSMDARLKSMVGSDEPALVAAMGRTPDSRTAPTPGLELLQWHWQKSYVIPDRQLAYTYAGGAIRPIPHTGTGTVRDECVAQWTVENGVATRYGWIGNDCPSASTELAARPAQ